MKHIPEQIRFDGKVAVITGAGRGVGRSYAELLAARGAKVVVNDLGVTTAGTIGTEASGSVAQEVAAAIAANGGEAVADTHSVVEEAGAIVDAAVRQWGRLDIVINNAGISGGGGLDEIPVEDYEQMVNVHYLGAVRVLRAAWPHLVSSGGGRVVNTSSTSIFGMAGTSHSISAKAGVFGLTRALAEEGRATGVVVNSVLPTAWTRLTRQIPDDNFAAWLEATCPPDLVAPFVAWLCSAEVPFSGEAFAVGGGRVARVFLGESSGVVHHNPAPESYRDVAEQLIGTAGFRVPANTVEEIMFFAAEIGNAAAAATSATAAGTATPNPEPGSWAEHAKTS